MRRSFDTLGGDIGEFLGTELRFEVVSESEIVLHAGPVPATLVDRPVRLEVHFEASGVGRALVQMPDGQTFALVPALP